ncbi:hypothetical protein M0802_005446 [Mischocyttarus mexicanus]|nr:hypothetical protein M0802_005446 [Mischocyttarus mexicanus]
MDIVPTDQKKILKAKEDIPNTLLQFLSDIITHDKSKSENFESVIIAIAHAIIAATRPSSFVSSVQLGLAVMLHKQYKSKKLIQILHSLGFCSSYYKLQLFEASILNHDEVLTFHESYGQEVSDNADHNADHNVSTINGRNTFHAMGSILTPSDPCLTQLQVFPYFTAHLQLISRSKVCGTKPLFVRVSSNALLTKINVTYFEENQSRIMTLYTQ